MRSRIRISDSGLSSSSSSCRVQISPPGSIVRAGLDRHRSRHRRSPNFARLPGFGLGFLVLGPDKAALDPHGAIMVEDDESPAARDVGGIIGLPLGLQPLDLGLKLAETRIDFVRQFLGVSCCSVRLLNSACAASRAA